LWHIGTRFRENHEDTFQTSQGRTVEKNKNQKDKIHLPVYVSACHYCYSTPLPTVPEFHEGVSAVHDPMTEQKKGQEDKKIEREEAVVTDNKRVQWSYASNTHDRERVHAQIETQIKQLLFFKHGSPFKNKLGWADFEIIIANKFPTVKTLHTGRFAIPHELATASAAHKPAREIKKRGGQSSCI